MAAPKRTLQELESRVLGAVVHRTVLLHEGFTVAQLRTLATSEHVDVLRRAWFCSVLAPEGQREAARHGGRITCISLARHRRWWVPQGIGEATHLHLPPGTTGPRLPEEWPGVTHWTRPLVPLTQSVVGTTEDALAHIALCLPYDLALVLWESAARAEGLAPEAVRAIRWSSRRAVELSAAVTGLADSGLEVLILQPLRRIGVRVRAQVWLAGKPVDLLIGERLVVQVDGWEHHSSASQRSRDIAHDAELRLRGYTVLRFSYEHVVRRITEVERTIHRALAAGLHLT